MSAQGPPARRASRAKRTRLAPTLALVAVTAVWGSTFPMIKDVVTTVPVPDFLAVRFAIAAVALVAVRPRAVARLSQGARRRAVVLGLLYGGAQVLQTYGLAHTSASVSGFVTGTYVVLTPLFGAVLLRQHVPRATWAAVALATAGLALLSLPGATLGGDGLGVALTLAAAALYALHILLLGAWSTAEDAFGLAVLQMIVIAGVCGVAAAPGGIVVPAQPGTWLAVVYMALVAGALALLVQTWAQAHLDATRAAVVMTLEPAFAALFAVVIGDETLAAGVLLGGALVLVAMYVAELGPRRSRDATLPHLARVNDPVDHGEKHLKRAS